MVARSVGNFASGAKFNRIDSEGRGRLSLQLRDRVTVASLFLCLVEAAAVVAAAGDAEEQQGRNLREEQSE